MNRRATLAALATTAVATLIDPPLLRAADPTQLQIGTMPTDGSAQPFYGLDRNFFKDAGFDVKLTILNNTASLASAVASGALEIGFGSVIPLAQAHLRGLDFQVIAPATIYNGTTPVNVIMVGNNSAVKKAADLNGQTVAVNGLRDLTQYEMQAWIDKNGGDVKSVKLIETPFSEMAVALEAGRVAAGILAEPFWTAALSTCRVIGNGSEAVGKHYMVTGWFASTDWLTKNAATAKRLQAVMLQPRRDANDRSEVHQDHARGCRAYGARGHRRYQARQGAHPTRHRRCGQIRRHAAAASVRPDLAGLIVSEPSLNALHACRRAGPSQRPACRRSDGIANGRHADRCGGPIVLRSRSELLSGCGLRRRVDDAQ
jgi:NitT/TauT family transport system substrate-binding protein